MKVLFTALLFLSVTLINGLPAPYQVPLSSTKPVSESGFGTLFKGLGNLFKTTKSKVVIHTPDKSQQVSDSEIEFLSKYYQYASKSLTILSSANKISRE